MKLSRDACECTIDVDPAKDSGRGQVRTTTPTKVDRDARNAPSHQPPFRRLLCIEGLDPILQTGALLLSKLLLVVCGLVHLDDEDVEVGIELREIRLRRFECGTNRGMQQRRKGEQI